MKLTWLPLTLTCCMLTCMVLPCRAQTPGRPLSPPYQQMRPSPAYRGNYSTWGNYTTPTPPPNRRPNHPTNGYQQPTVYQPPTVYQRPQQPVPQQIRQQPFAPPVAHQYSPTRSNLAGNTPPTPRFSAIPSSVSGQAEQLLQHGVSLANRDALFSARAEFIKALRLTCQALDATNSSRLHANALQLAFKALNEADDFILTGSQLESDHRIHQLIQLHETPVLKDRLGQLEAISALVATQHYYSYAKDQLAIAADRNPTASRVLTALGKYHSAMSRHKKHAREMHGQKAVVFHQAALITDRQNHEAANELAVFMARADKLVEAKQLLLQSLRISPKPETWHNLAVVHSRLQEHELARRARHEQSLLSTANVTAEHQNVRWVSRQEFEGAKR